MSVLQSCPGATLIKEPVPEVFPCPRCGADVEIWTHEVSYRCDRCGTEVFREAAALPSCIEWCEAAKECVGEDAYNRYFAMKKKSDVHGITKDH